MKYSKIFLIAGFVLFAARSIADTLPQKVPVAFNKVYIPDGFDDNDNVEITGEGMFANTCYRYAESRVNVDESTKTIHVAATAYKYDGPCLMVMLPFDRVIEVGLLKVGTYSVVQDNGGAALGQISVRKALTAAPDDYLYAPISQAFYQSKDGENKIFLSGNFPVSCMKFTEIKTQVQPDVIVVQPIVELDTTVPCTPGSYHFETSTTVIVPKPGRYLIHVRSMNGKSVNNIVDIPVNNDATTNPSK